MDSLLHRLVGQQVSVVSISQTPAAPAGMHWEGTLVSHDAQWLHLATAEEEWYIPVCTVRYVKPEGALPAEEPVEEEPEVIHRITLDEV